jgi:hypothetical protein
MRCKNCKYYKKPMNSYDLKKDRGLCINEKFVYEVSDSYPLNDKLEYWDNEGYNAGFCVGKNFGCIHFVKK